MTFYFFSKFMSDACLKCLQFFANVNITRMARNVIVIVQMCQSIFDTINVSYFKNNILGASHLSYLTMLEVLFFKAPFYSPIWLLSCFQNGCSLSFFITYLFMFMFFDWLRNLSLISDWNSGSPWNVWENRLLQNKW